MVWQNEYNAFLQCTLLGKIPPINFKSIPFSHDTAINYYVGTEMVNYVNYVNYVIRTPMFLKKFTLYYIIESHQTACLFLNTVILRCMMRSGLVLKQNFR